MNSRPGGVTAVCIIAILLGAMGLMASLIGAASLAVGEQRMREMMPTPQRDAEVTRLQAEMQEEAAAVTRPWKPLTIALTVLELLVSAGLIVGSAMTLGLRESWRRILRNILLLTIPLEIVRSLLQAYFSLGMADVMGKYMPLVMAAQSKGNKMPVNLGANFAKISLIGGLAIVAIWLLATLAFYITSWFYLNRPHVRAAFAVVPASDELA